MVCCGAVSTSQVMEEGQGNLLQVTVLFPFVTNQSWKMKQGME